jgi:L-asparaginase II
MIKTLTDQCSPSHPLILAPLRCELWRGSALESTHEVHAALVNTTGELLAYAGDPQLTTTARSSLKPFQLLPTLRLGGEERFDLLPSDIALMCASHNGEPLHVQHCEQLLKKLGYEPSALECGSHFPYNQAAAHALIRAGLPPQAIHNNCSGKHCGLLALSALLNSEGSYLEPTHPTQRTIFEGLERLLGVKDRTWKIGVDGCSLPTPAISLCDFAELFAYLAAGSSPHDPSSGASLSRIFEAMSAHPDLVAGTGRFDTAFITHAQGRAVCKVGGEAIRGFAIRDITGRALGLTLKVTDGAMRALHPACLALLARLELIDQPQDLYQSPSQSSLNPFWRGAEQSWAGHKATEIRVHIHQ